MSFKNDKKSKDLNNLQFEQIAKLDQQVTDGQSFSYYENANITNATVYRNKISGHVGNFLEEFDVNISVHGNQITGSCSCKDSRQICKHIVVLLYSWVQDGQDFIDVEKKLELINELDKERLVEIVSNIIRTNPGFTELFLSKDKPDWDDIEPIDPGQI